MIVKKVRIENFKSINDSDEVNIDGKITILMGKNEQGKTNFLTGSIFFQYYNFRIDVLDPMNQTYLYTFFFYICLYFTYVSLCEQS